MATYRCIRQCQHKRRMWFPGEIAEFSETDSVPYHFEKVAGDVVVQEPKINKPEPIQFAKAADIPPVTSGYGAALDTQWDISEPKRSKGRPKKGAL